MSQFFTEILTFSFPISNFLRGGEREGKERGKGGEREGEGEGEGWERGS